MLKEKIACVCCGNKDICYGQNPIKKGIVQGDVCSINLRKANQIHKEYMDWFKQEIEKMGVISDEEIGEAGDWRYEEGELYCDCVDCGLDTDRVRAIAQAQLQDCKDTLLRMME